MSIYVGTRLKHDEMISLVGHNLGRLNQSLSKTLRQAAMDNGIKQSVKGERLDFYSISKSEYENLKVDSRMLIAIDEEKMTRMLNEINSKEAYAGGMSYEVHQQYLKELRSAMCSIVEKIGEDSELPRAKIETFTHDYNVGDWIEIKGGWGTLVGNARITKVTEKTFTYEIARIFGRRCSNFDYAKKNFINVEGEGDSNFWDFIIPISGNEWAFTFEGRKTERAKRQNHNKVTPGYRSKLSPDSPLFL